MHISYRPLGLSPEIALDTVPTCWWLQDEANLESGFNQIMLAEYDSIIHHTWTLVCSTPWVGVGIAE